MPENRTLYKLHGPSPMLRRPGIEQTVGSGEAAGRKLLRPRRRLVPRGTAARLSSRPGCHGDGGGVSAVLVDPCDAGLLSRLVTLDGRPQRVGRGDAGAVYGRDDRVLC